MGWGTPAVKCVSTVSGHRSQLCTTAYVRKDPSTTNPLRSGNDGLPLTIHPSSTKRAASPPNSRTTLTRLDRNAMNGANDEHQGCRFSATKARHGWEYTEFPHEELSTL